MNSSAKSHCKDFHRKDLEEAIKNGAPPKWKFGIQTVSEEDEHKFDFDILDATKVWPEELVPFQEIGELVLNRTVDEYFPETEQVAFCTSHVVPGIGFSDDPLLQGRNFSYFDTQISRLGINWEQLPINRPVCPVMNHHRDGKLIIIVQCNRILTYILHRATPDAHQQDLCQLLAQSLRRISPYAPFSWRLCRVSVDPIPFLNVSHYYVGRKWQ